MLPTWSWKIASDIDLIWEDPYLQKEYHQCWIANIAIYHHLYMDQYMPFLFSSRDKQS